MTRAALFFIMLSAIAFTGCVSVKLASTDTSTRATGVQVSEPRYPFAKEERSEVDAAWKNSRNGNVISYLSDCKDPTDPPLEQVVQGVVMGLSELKYDSNENTMMLGREAKRVQASGKVDGVASQLDLLVFKRNHCIYILSYVGVKAAFAADHGEFNRFVQGFRVP